MATEEKPHVGTDMLEIEESDELEHNLQYPTYGMLSMLASNVLLYVVLLVNRRDYHMRIRPLLFYILM